MSTRTIDEVMTALKDLYLKVKVWTCEEVSLTSNLRLSLTHQQNRRKSLLNSIRRILWSLSTIYRSRLRLY